MTYREIYNKTSDKLLAKDDFELKFKKEKIILVLKGKL